MHDQQYLMICNMSMTLLGYCNWSGTDMFVLWPRGCTCWQNTPSAKDMGKTYTGQTLGHSIRSCQCFTCCLKNLLEPVCCLIVVPVCHLSKPVNGFTRHNKHLLAVLGLNIDGKLINASLRMPLGHLREIDS